MTITHIPFVSLVLPIYNEAVYIEHCLQAVFSQDYSGEIEILVADGMSTDKTRQVINELIKCHPEITLDILDNPGKIVPIGINIALQKARGDVIIRVDGHTIIAPDYVSQCVEALQRTDADNVGGRMNKIGIKRFGNVVALATSTPFGIGGGRFHYSDEEEWVDTVYMGAWPRKVFEIIGLFDEELVRDQDDEFNYRLREEGGKILLSPKIKSEYTVRSSPVALWKQYFQYGFWKVRVLQKHPRQMSLRHFVPPAFVLSLVISVLLVLSPVPRSLSYIVTLLYLFANFSASIYTASNRGLRYLPLLPLTFAILHLSYGSGFLVGLLKFRNRWGDKVGKTPAWSGNTS